MAEDEYEYAIVTHSLRQGRDFDLDDEAWGELDSAQEELDLIQEGVDRNAERGYESKFKYRIVKRRKAGKIEEL